MSVTKRTRFEVLRRDNYTCQYCGSRAPDVVLHIDHVEPVALGGSDKPDNLVTACKDCNSGKSSIAPGSPIVERLSAKAAAYALGMIDKMTRIRASLEEGDEYADRFLTLWSEWRTQDGAGDPLALPDDWESSIHRWFRMGVPFRMLELAIPVAMRRVRNDGVFKYFAGIVWNQIDDAEIDHSVTVQSVAVYTRDEAESLSRREYWIGFSEGRESAALAGTRDRLDEPLRVVV